MLMIFDAFGDVFGINTMQDKDLRERIQFG